MIIRKPVAVALLTAALICAPAVAFACEQKPSPSDTPTESPTPTDTPSPTDTPTPTDSPTPTNTPTVAPTETPTDDPSPTSSNNPTVDPAPTPTDTLGTLYCSHSHCRLPANCCTHSSNAELAHTGSSMLYYVLGAFLFLLAGALVLAITMNSGKE